MHWFRWFGALMLVVLLARCEKARGVFGREGAAGGEPGTFLMEPGGEVDPALAGLVSRSDQGISFRRDLDFPAEIRGILSVTRDLAAVRVMESSPLGRETSSESGKFETRMSFTKGAGQFTMKLDRVERGIIEAGEAEKPEVRSLPEQSREGKSLYFGVSEQGWYFQAPQGAKDYDLENWAEDLGEEFPRLLVDAGAHPRAQWFSSARVWRSGDRIVLTGHAVKLLDPFDSTGRVVLVFEGEEAVGGHPCGVFSVEGSYSVDNRITPYGARESAEVTVTQGRIWASLLHPVLLREEYDAVQTITRRAASGPEVQVQGSMKITRARSWAPKS